MKTPASILMKSFFSIIGLLCFNSILTAQQATDELRRKLEGKRTFAEIMSTVDEYFKEQPQEEEEDEGEEEEDEQLHWRRWGWYMSRHLGPEGEFVNYNKMYYDAINTRGEQGTPSTRSPFEGSWTSLGPRTSTDTPGGFFGKGIGRVDRIAFDPVNANIFYVGTPNGGLWKTYNGGQTWEPLLDTFPSLGISGISVSPSNANEIFILTGIGDSFSGNYYQSSGSSASLGVFRSLDGGQTWAFTSTFPVPGGGSYLGYDLEQSPASNNILLAATDVGIFRTNNSGASWQLVQSGLFYDVEFKPGSGTVAYAANANTIYRSTNGGEAWTASTLDQPPLTTPIRIALAVTPANPSIVYAMFGNQPGKIDTFSGVYFSDNEGANFTRRATSPNIQASNTLGTDNFSQAVYDLCIAAHPVEANRVVVGSCNIWQSINSANSFSYLRGWNYNVDSLYVHVDQHAIAYNPLNNKLYMCNDGGIWVSGNNGVSVINITTGLALTEFYHLTQDYSESFKLVGGTQDNGVFFRNMGSDHFLKVLGGDGFDAAFVAGDPNLFYASAGTSITRINGTTGAIVNITPFGDPLAFKEILSHPTNPNIVFCAGDNTIWKSTYQGDYWTDAGGKGSWAMAISSSNTNYMYAAGSSNWFYGPGEAYRSVDEGDSWQLMSNAPGFPSLQNFLLTGISVHPNNHLHVTATIGGFSAGNKVFHSGNGGDSWINITYNLPNVPVLSIVTTTEGIFVGTGISVYFIVHESNQWIDIGSNIPHAMITDLNYDQNSGTLIASTMGRGVWQRNVCVDDITLTYPLSGDLKFSCDDQLTSSSLITGDAIDSINFRANGDIKLTPGFHIESGAYLKAKIESCDDEDIPFQGSTPESNASTAPPPTVMEKRRND